MKPKRIELRPDWKLLNSNFEGYKLSLAEFQVCEKALPNPIDQATPDSNQYSLLHARLFGLHNHLYAEEIHGVNYLYFIDKEWHVYKLYLESFVVPQFIEPFVVWQIPKSCERQEGHYNISLKFASPEIVVLTAPGGVLYLLNTGDRSLDTTWNVIFKSEILGGEKDLIVKDAVLCKDTNELHVLLLSIGQDASSERWMNILNWVVMSCDNKEWSVVANRELRATGELYYSSFEPDCRAVYISSEKSFKFTDDKDENSEEGTQEEKEKKYIWSQTVDDVTVKLKLPENYIKSGLKITAKTNEISIQYENSVLLSGHLCKNISAALTVWKCQNDVLELALTKEVEGIMWPEFIQGDNSGEYVVDASVADEIHQKLAHLCSQDEANPGASVISQQVEECDFANKESCILERIPWNVNDIRHQVNLDTNPLILTVKLHDELPPALGLKHDIDVCVWQPYSASSTDWPVKHEGTLLAFAYVQASKLRRYMACSPDFNHSVVCESRRHIFVYCQNKPITNGTLRNRSTGKNIGTVAEQRVINIGDLEILGLYVSNSELFVLAENKMYCFKL